MGKPLANERMKSARARALDKRNFIRIPVQLKVDIEASQQHYLFEISSNLSASGIFIHTHDPLDPGTHLNLQFRLPDDFLIRTRGEVMWVNEGDEEEEPGMGVKFLQLNSDDRHRILTVIKKLAIL